MRHWWVNQNQTYAHEVGGGFLWSPKVNKNGARNQFYDNMREVLPGDVVFSFCDTLIKAVGVAQGNAKSAGKPTAFGHAGANWGDEGWLVPVKFTELKSPIRPKDHIDVLAPTLPQKYSPLRSNGDGLQSVYLAKCQTGWQLFCSRFWAAKSMRFFARVRLLAPRSRLMTLPRKR
jgi:hypothetical protein